MIIDTNKTVSLARKLSVIITLGLTLMFAAITLYSVYLLKNKIEDDFETKLSFILSGFSETLSKPLWDFDTRQIKNLTKNMARYDFIDYVAVYDDEGRIVSESGKHKNHLNHENLFELFEDEKEYYKSVEYFYKGKSQNIGKFHVHVNFKQQKLFIEQFVITVFLIGSAFYMMLIIFIHKVTNSAIYPITVISRKISQISQGENVSLPEINSNVTEIKFLHDVMNDYKSYTENYQVNLEYEVTKRTEELEDYKAHLELLVEEQTKDLVQARDEALESSRIKSDFLANISHELRTPMHAIINYSDMGLEKAGGTEIEKITKYFNNINISSKRLLNLINQLLDLSKLESGKLNLFPSETSLEQLTEEVLIEVDSLIRSKSLTIYKDVSGDVSGYFDGEKIYRVIMNLLSNAIKFSPSGGRIEISINKDQGKLNFRIADTGPGIPANELDAIFDSFVQSSKTKTGAGGTGLGLAICKQIIGLHNGDIWAENRFDEAHGCLFTFSIPEKFVYKGGGES